MRYRNRILHHWLFLIILAGGTIIRLLAEQAYHPAILFFGDSFFYLQDAVLLSPISFHPLGYAWFLRLLSIFGNLIVVTIVQHLLGLVSAVLIYILLLRLGVNKWLSATSTLPILFDGYVIDLESMILTETLISFFFILTFVILFWKKTIPNLYLVILGLLLSLATITRGSSFIILLPILGYVILNKTKGKLSNLKVTLLPAAILLIAFTVPIIGYSIYHSSAGGGFTIDNKTPFFLYSKLAPIANCSDLNKQQRVLCGSDNKAHDANWYLWSLNSPLRKNLQTDSFMVPESTLKQFDVAVLKKQAPAYIYSVISQTSSYFTFSAIKNTQDSSINNWKLPTKVVWTPNVRLSSSTFSPTTPQTNVPKSLPNKNLATFLHNYQKYVFLPGPVMGFTILLSLSATIIGDRRLALISITIILMAMMYLLFTSALAALIYRYIVPVEELFAVSGIIAAQSLLNSSSLKSMLKGRLKHQNKL